MATQTAAQKKAAKAAKDAPVPGNDAVREAVEREDVEFPCTMFHARKNLTKFPMGFEERRVESPGELSRLGAGWMTSYDGMLVMPPEDEADPDDDN